MPGPHFRHGKPLLAALLASTSLLAGAAKSPAPDNSNLDRQLFYQLLVGEIELRSGEAGTAFELVMDAAKRNPSEQLYKRAADIALQARAGEQGLTAARAWRQSFPGSAEALRYVVQILIALNRAPEAVEPLQALVEATPVPQRPAVIATLPRFFGRLGDKAQAATLVERALAPYVGAKPTAAIARSAVARAWLAAGEPPKALALLQRAHADDAQADAPALVAVDMLANTASAEAIVTGHLRAKPDSNTVRFAYARALTNAQRYGEAADQLEAVTKNDAKLAGPWLTLGALQLELRQPDRATASVKQYVALVEGGDKARPESQSDSDEDGTDDEAARPDLTQAWLLLAQAAEQQKDFKAAEDWLGRIDDPQRALDVQARRASLLARQGKLPEARELLHRLPERAPGDARSKLMAEAQLLRDAKDYGEAHQVLAQATQKFPDDVDLLYEQSMAAEKLDRVDEMEKLLRRVIALKPDHHHAYNALGYSLAERNLRLPEAKTLIQKALELSPGEPFITDSLGWVEFRLGNKDVALKYLRTAYQARPDPEIAAHLGEVLWVNGQRDEAMRVWREARNRDAANDVLRETLARLRVDL